MGPHLVEVRCVTKSSNEGQIFGPHLVGVRCVTKSSDEGQFFLTTFGLYPLCDIFWTTFGRSPLCDKVLRRGAIYIRCVIYSGPHLVEVRCVTKSSDEGQIYGPHMVEVRCVCVCVCVLTRPPREEEHWPLLHNNASWHWLPSL